jgi:hypothetical protein
LLDALAKTPAERQQLLRVYWEPSEQEREDGAKRPTAAHRAIAALVAQGFVRVILTTNFDRLMLYTLGLGAVEAGRLRFLGRLFSTMVHREHREPLPAVRLLPPSCLFSEGGREAQFLEGMDSRFAPLNDWLHAALRQPTKRLIPNEGRYTYVFDKLEVLMALGCAHYVERAKDWYWVPLGAFGYRHQNRDRVLHEIEESISKLKGESPFVKSGIFGETAVACTEALAAFKEFVLGVVRSWH